MKTGFSKGCRFLTVLFALIPACGPANSQSLRLAWQKDFEKSVLWYARTSPGILLVRTQKSLTALDSADGRQLWVISDAGSKKLNMGGVEPGAERGRNVVELPGMGVVLLNGLEFAGDSEPKLSAINLMTGERIWDQPQVDDLMTAVPLYESRGIILVSRRLQKKTLAKEMAIGSLVPLPLMLQMDPYLHPYPFRFEIERRELETGKVRWSTEYPHTFTPGTTVVKVLGANVFLSYSNQLLGCLDASSGKVLWEDGKKKFLGNRNPALPIEMANGRVIYGSKDVVAVQPEGNRTGWRIEKLGKVTGIFVHDGSVVAIGEKMIAAVDTENGVERWRKKTHGHTTNLIWDRESDGILYADWKGLHSVERTSGRPLLDANLHIDAPPYHLRMASLDCVLAIGNQETTCVSLKTGKKLFTEGKLSAVFRGEAYLDNWPMPEEGQELVRLVSIPTNDADWEIIRRNTLLSGGVLKSIQENTVEPDGLSDVYLTESAEGVRKIWWVDGKTNAEVVIRPAAQQHDVSRPLGKVFAVNGHVLWAATIVEK
jgi:outer membrane protein assembly factor BamB